MGWTGYYDFPACGAKAEMDRIYSFTNPDGTVAKVLDSAIVNLSEYYCAMEVTKPDGTRFVTCGVAMLHIKKKGYDPFMYKDMDETVGPTIAQCPKRIFDLLTPLSERTGHIGYAKEWRERVAALHAAREAAKRVKCGTTIKIDQPVGFGAYGAHDTFTKVDYGRKRDVFRIPTGQLVRFTGWRNMAFDILN